jgi:hypothetical protein
MIAGYENDLHSEHLVVPLVTAAWLRDRIPASARGGVSKHAVVHHEAASPPRDPRNFVEPFREIPPVGKRLLCWARFCHCDHALVCFVLGQTINLEIDSPRKFDQISRYRTNLHEPGSLYS